LAAYAADSAERKLAAAEKREAELREALDLAIEHAARDIIKFQGKCVEVGGALLLKHDVKRILQDHLAPPDAEQEQSQQKSPRP
jgi:hypothetical protein